MPPLWGTLVGDATENPAYPDAYNNLSCLKYINLVRAVRPVLIFICLMLSLFTKHKYYVLLIALFILAEIIVNPTGNFPLNDDGTYGKSIRKLFVEDVYDIGTSSSTTWTHLMWGMLFTKLFGFSFLVLRFST